MCDHICIHIHTGTYKCAHKQKKRESLESLVYPKPSPSRATVGVTSQSSGELSVLCLWPPVKLCSETVGSPFHLCGFLTQGSALIWPRAHQKASIPQDRKMGREYCTRLKEMRVKPERTSLWEGEFITTQQIQDDKEATVEKYGLKTLSVLRGFCESWLRILKLHLLLPVHGCAEKWAQKLTLKWKV